MRPPVFLHTYTNDDFTIPVLGFGTYLIHDKDTIAASMEWGYKHIDTAWMYKNEKQVGVAIKEALEKGWVKREHLFVTTKVWPTHWDSVAESIEQSLDDLGLDYVDLVLQHWPMTFKKQIKDGEVELFPKNDDGSPALDDGTFIDFYRNLETYHLANKDKVRAIGVSNFPVEYLETLLQECQVKPKVNQVECHPQLPQHELREYCQQHGIVLECFSPFGSSGAPVLQLDVVQELAQKYNVPPADVVVYWNVIKRNGVLPRTTKVERLKHIYQYVPLTEDDVKRLDSVTPQHRYCDISYAKNVPGFTGRVEV